MTVIPTDLKYATTVSFWIALYSLFLDNSMNKKILLSFSFSVSICGLFMQYFKPTKNIILNLIHYGIPLFISLYYLQYSNKYNLSIKLFIPILLYYFIININNINLNIQYNNFNEYSILNLILTILYFTKL